ncbi:MAG: PA2779 family protein [Desulfovermiculus sp.]
MYTSPKMFQIISVVVLVVFCSTLLPAPALQAAMLGTDSVLPSKTDATRTQLQELLQRDDVEQSLQEHGIDVQEAKARVMTLSDAELEQIQGRLDTLPAGEGAVGAIVGGAVFIFVVLLITDILGFTNVFTFVHGR